MQVIPHGANGLFTCREDLDEYEALWNDQIFKPAHSKVANKRILNMDITVSLIINFIVTKIE
jgi:hypothetical protein